mmetsp:Transcript_23817/g.66076  ORF Transcript_23817/g.66076 Transcript_23817/m.66076 type:complete len:552 (+) Transcript_23817:178-1833(+)|eukprot:CAMPEP_0117670572 /NCGR_PEP_ID=MMETSP0804-20121206/12840_1 /TAXON_ID=1074897 /ORGANISM="Tetraselmis astigmatica, Strain CCMP880" /LENGTH=551 /DNA_ID=CAMNT_0005478911 /DNA_START=95 /DNA_END=1750 /DNA_ORIENTATION=+
MPSTVQATRAASPSTRPQGGRAGTARRSCGYTLPKWHGGLSKVQVPFQHRSPGFVCYAQQVEASSGNGAASVGTEREARPLKVLIAGGGIGGLSAALSCRRNGMDVTVFEKVQEYKPFGGPIQLQCNALSALECIAPDVYAKVQQAGTVTGDRINGLLDGVSGEWFYRFDTRKPCHRHGLPLTTVVSRYDLLDFLQDAVGSDLKPGRRVVSYENTKDKVIVTLEDGTIVEGDVLIGADGIRSKVRAQMRKEVNGPPLKYAGYAVYTAVCDYSAIHTDPSKVGYQVFLGEKQYFVSSDVGNGQQQYYAFLDVPPGGNDKWAACEDWDNYRDMLLDRFQGWAPAVIERLECTRPEDVERRDVNDLAPDPRWVDGRVALLGDACHAVQPNLGQGGGQAIESSFVLGVELAKAVAGEVEVGQALNQYCQKRFLRAGAIHGLSRLSSIMNTGYRPYLGSEPYDFYPEPLRKMWHSVEKLKIPHPGRVIGQVALIATMDGVLDYVGSGLNLPQKLGGASTGNGEYRVPQCQVPGISAPKRDIVPKEFEMQGVPGLAK